MTETTRKLHAGWIWLLLGLAFALILWTIAGAIFSAQLGGELGFRVSFALIGAALLLGSGIAMWLHAGLEGAHTVAAPYAGKQKVPRSSGDLVFDRPIWH